MEKNTTWELGERKGYPQLSGTAQADVAIVGGGLAGLLSAYLLSKAGKKVAVLEKGTIGGGVTQKTTAFITQVIDTDYSVIAKNLGKVRAGFVANSHGKAIELIRNIVRVEHIDCEFMDCSDYIFSNDVKDNSGLEKECSAMKELGIEAEFNPKGDLGINAAGYIEIKNQAKFHPLKFMRALAEIIVKDGGQIYENTEATELKGDSVITREGKVGAGWIIITTHRPFNKPLGLFFKKAMYISYVLELEVLKTKMLEGIYEDTYNPYHYFRIDNVEEKARVILGGEDHRMDIKQDREKKFAALEKYASKVFGEKNYKVARRWSGPILESVDGLAYIGQYKKANTIYAMAFSGNGMTYSGITALIANDLVTAGKNNWMQIYRPGRIPYLRMLMSKSMDYMQELWNGVIRKSSAGYVNIMVVIGIFALALIAGYFALHFRGNDSAIMNNMKGFVVNIEAETLANDYFRRVLYTDKNDQLVVMSLKPMEDIGKEVHQVDQFIRIESGEGKAILNGTEYALKDGSSILVPAGAEHNIVNTSASKSMKLYTLYSPPNHRDHVIHKTKADAEADTTDVFEGKTTE